jgi:hypothetical protein
VPALFHFALLAQALSSGHQRYVAVSHGHSGEAVGAGCLSLTWVGEKPKLHGMQALIALYSEKPIFFSR